MLISHQILFVESHTIGENEYRSLGSTDGVLLVGQDIRYINLETPSWILLNKPLLNYKFYALMFFIWLFLLLVS